LDETDLLEAQRQLSEDLPILKRMLDLIELKSGILSEKEDSILLANLCSLQDLTTSIYKDEGFYDDTAQALYDFSSRGKELLKRFKDFPLRGVLARTIERIDLYLKKLPKYQGYGKEHEQKNEPTLKARIDEELGKKADELLRDASNQILVEELSKHLYRINNKGKTIAQLSESKEKTLDEKLELAASALILSQLRRRTG